MDASQIKTQRILPRIGVLTQTSLQSKAGAGVLGAPT
jgi:hypothetical protein